MKYGYARCSTNEDKQDIQRQIRELKASGADEIVFEYEHGDAKVKRNLQMLLDTAREGDTIITLEVSRLSRSTQCLYNRGNTAALPDHRRYPRKAPLPANRRLHYHQLSQRSDRPDERSVSANGGCIQPTGTCHDSRPCQIRHGERKSQGQADRQTAPDQRRYSCIVPAALSGV